VPRTDRESPITGGVGSRIFASAPDSIEQIREFVDERLERVLRPNRGSAGQGSSPSVSSLQLTIHVLPEHVEVTVGDGARGVGFRDWLADVLRREGMSQESAARRLGVSLKTVNRWLRGHSEPRMRELRRVREVFGDPPLS
jgi:DNA-binding XRE family transcriptional regulator